MFTRKFREGTGNIRVCHHHIKSQRTKPEPLKEPGYLWTAEFTYVSNTTAKLSCGLSLNSSQRLATRALPLLQNILSLLLPTLGFLLAVSNMPRHQQSVLALQEELSYNHMTRPSRARSHSRAPTTAR